MAKADRAGLTRRALLGGVASFAATIAAANAPQTSIRPQARGPKIPANAPPARTAFADLIAAAQLDGVVGLMLQDVETGEVLLRHEDEITVPPASVTKAVTALYALENLTPGFQIETRIFAIGEVSEGILSGDLIIAGGGDPDLLTDDLAKLAENLAATGLRQVTGRYLFWDGALPDLEEIDPAQLDFLGYNPSLSGLNLNFNRVHFEWKRNGANYAVTMDARSDLYRPAVTMAQMQVVDRGAPLFTYASRGGRDEWTVARGALGNAGSRWLPVRKPGLYAAEVFASFAKSQGVTLPAPEETLIEPQGQVIASHQSAPLRDKMRDMLLYSTNITAEAAGLLATKAASGSLRGMRTSALGMARWMNDKAGTNASFVDHSGLGDETRISAQDMTRLLASPGVPTQLQPILKDIPILDDDGKPRPEYPGAVHAKTGTLNFVSTLAGYVRTTSGRNLCFAIFAADLESREAAKKSGDEQPAGSVAWNSRAKKLQQALLARWVLIH